MSLVSIIVPVYNTEGYLEGCLDSLLSQTHRELDIILVDDGSTDSSGSVCDGYAERDGRVRVFHLENGGVSRARNFGIENALGEYIIFVDSDDSLKPDAVECELSALEESGSELALFSLVYDDGKTQNQPTLKERVYSPKEYLLDAEQDITHLCSPCNKIYKADVIRENAIRFTDGIKYGEDFIFNSSYLCFVKKLTVKNEAYYYYDISREGSGVKRLYPEYDGFIVRIDEAFRTMLSNLGISDDKKRLDFMERRWDYAVDICVRSGEDEKEKAKILSRWIDRIPEDDLRAFCEYKSMLAELCRIGNNPRNIKRALRAHKRKESFRKFTVKIKRFLRRI